MLIARALGWAFDPGLYEVLLLVAGLVVLVGAIALSVQRGRPFSAALIYLGAGVLAGLVLRGVGINWNDPIEDAVLFSRVAELAVVVSLFGAGVNRTLSRRVAVRQEPAQIQHQPSGGTPWLEESSGSVGVGAPARSQSLNSIRRRQPPGSSGSAVRTGT